MVDAGPLTVESVLLTCFISPCIPSPAHPCHLFFPLSFLHSPIHLTLNSDPVLGMGNTCKVYRGWLEQEGDILLSEQELLMTTPLKPAGGLVSNCQPKGAQKEAAEGS